MSDIAETISSFGLTKLARELGLSIQTVAAWKARNSLPAERVIDVERVTGVSRHDLRPDIFGPPPPATSESGAAA